MTAIFKSSQSWLEFYVKSRLFDKEPIRSTTYDADADPALIKASGLENTRLKGKYVKTIEENYSGFVNFTKAGKILDSILKSESVIVAGGLFTALLSATPNADTIGDAIAENFSYTYANMSDIDLYVICSHLQQFVTTVKHIYKIISEGYGEKNVEMILKKNAISFVTKGADKAIFQVINSCYFTAADAVSSFDINVCQIYATSTGIMYSRQAYHGLVTRSLKIVNEHLGTEFRIRKYMKRGFYWPTPVPEPVSSKSIVNVTNLERHYNSFETGGFIATLETRIMSAYIMSMGSNYTVYAPPDVAFVFEGVRNPMSISIPSPMLDGGAFVL